MTDTPHTEIQQADTLAEQAAELANRLAKLEDQQRPRPEPLPTTSEELKRRRRP